VLAYNKKANKKMATACNLKSSKKEKFGGKVSVNARSIFGCGTVVFFFDMTRN
jgi:hypothetical protein